MKKATYALQITGTCTYMIFWEKPIRASSGVYPKISTARPASPTSAIQPSHRITGVHVEECNGTTSPRMTTALKAPGDRGLRRPPACIRARARGRIQIRDGLIIPKGPLL